MNCTPNVVVVKYKNSSISVRLPTRGMKKFTQNTLIQFFFHSFTHSQFILQSRLLFTVQ